LKQSFAEVTEMVFQLQSAPKPEIIYPDSDGKPMSDNTKQFRWIVVIQQNLEWLFADDPNVFVAGDLLWYPVEGNPKLRQAPDVMVVLGRAKGDRGSYQQWKEDDMAPQVVFEILSPGNTQTEMNKKMLFYQRYGVEEYYLYDPDKNDLSGWIFSSNNFEDSAAIDPIDNWVSPRLKVRFDLSGEELQIIRPDGERFLSYVDIAQKLKESEQRTEQAEQRAEQAEQRAEQAEQRAVMLAEQLRALGVKTDNF
jgi:Uma2 family endonuclease